jgi:hypothetical protein
MSNRLDRDEHGHFVKGNTVRKLVPGLARVYELKTAFLNASSPEKVADVEAAMYDLALNDPDSRVRLAAQVEYLNRTVGKPSTQIDVLKQSYEEVHQHSTIRSARAGLSAAMNIHTSTRSSRAAGSLWTTGRCPPPNGPSTW